MLKIHNYNDGSTEEEYAQKIGDLAREAIPDIDTNDDIKLEIVPSVQIFKSSTRDVDILLIYQDYRKDHELYVTAEGRKISNFITTVELKRTSPEQMKFEGEKFFVRYWDKPWSNVLHQSEGQKVSVMTYIKSNVGRQTPNKRFNPFITNLIYAPLLPKNRLPKNYFGNVVHGQSNWFDFLEVLGKTVSNKISDICAIHNHQHIKYEFDAIIKLFTKKTEFSALDVQKFEKVTSDLINQSNKQYIDKLGKQLLIFKGRGGSGKTSNLINLAYSIYKERNQRVLILTYNNALVSDLTRQLKYHKVKNNIGTAGLNISTIHRFMMAWFKGLANVHNLDEFYESTRQIFQTNIGNFDQNFEMKKDSFLNYLNSNLISKGDLEQVKANNNSVLDWDYIMIDESQDWPENERDLLYELYGAEKIVIADGEDQLVRSTANINWRIANLSVPSQVVPLRKSLRLKSSLCNAVQAFAKQIDYDWKLEPEVNSYGGKVVLITGNVLGDDFQNWLKSEVAENKDKSKIEPIDVLSCVPPSWVKKKAGETYSILGEVLEKRGEKIWDGTHKYLREMMATELNQFRIVQYESCRGLEGWISINYAIDEFYDHKLKHAPNPQLENQTELFYNEEEEKKEYAEQWAKKWLFIPLTRAIDTLVLHVDDEQSVIGEALLKLQLNHPNDVSLKRFT